MTGAEGRSDWEYELLCPSGGADHLKLTASASGADPDPEDCFPIDQCPVCGDDLDVTKTQSSAGVMD